LPEQDQPPIIGSAERRNSLRSRRYEAAEVSEPMLIVWIVRLVLLASFLPLVIPFAMLAGALTFAPMPVALLLLALSLSALGIVLGLILGVLGALADVLIVLVLIGIVWNWPRGIRAAFPAKLRLALRGLRNLLGRQTRHTSTTECALCLSIVLIALVLSLSSGLFHLLATALLVLIAVGVTRKWPQGPHLTVPRKLRIALAALWDDLRHRFR